MTSSPRWSLDQGREHLNSSGSWWCVQGCCSLPLCCWCCGSRMGACPWSSSSPLRWSYWISLARRPCRSADRMRWRLTSCSCSSVRFCVAAPWSYRWAVTTSLPTLAWLLLFYHGQSWSLSLFSWGWVDHLGRFCQLSGRLRTSHTQPANVGWRWVWPFPLYLVSLPSYVPQWHCRTARCPSLLAWFWRNLYDRSRSQSITITQVRVTI